jgi:hypothetical protein
MRSIFTTAAAGVIVGVGLLTSGASPINAAVFSAGPPENIVTNLACMNVRYNSTAAGTPVIAYDCHAGPEQQFEFAEPDCVTQTSFSACAQYPKNVPPGTTIYTVPSNPVPTESASYFNCLDVSGAGTANGTPVISYPCNGGVNQQFIYKNGQIVVYTSINTPKCLDATDMANFTQIIINDCTTSASQQWQIKGAVLTNGTPNGAFGGNVCASANPLMPVTPRDFPINAEDCQVGPNQRFDFAGSTIYMNSVQRCMSLTAFGVIPGLVNDFCTGSTDQQFYYSNGLIVAVKTGQCLDRTLASPEAESVLYFANCNESDTQQWQIK